MIYTKTIMTEAQMSDGLDSHRDDPMGWAVGTVIEGNTQKLGRSAEELVENVWEFIVACFYEEGIDPPDQQAVVARVASVLSKV